MAAAGESARRGGRGLTGRLPGAGNCAHPERRSSSNDKRQPLRASLDRLGLTPVMSVRPIFALSAKVFCERQVNKHRESQATVSLRRSRASPPYQMSRAELFLTFPIGL